MAVGTIAAAPNPWSPRKISKPISLGTKGNAIEVTVTQTEPQMKINCFPYTSANLPHNNCYHQSESDCAMHVVENVQGNIRMSANRLRLPIAVDFLGY